jgi:hypothetical protein
LPVETFIPEVIRYRQRLAQTARLQFNTTSILWKLLALRNSLRSTTLTRRYRHLYSSLKDDTMKALKFVLPHSLLPCSQFVLYTPFHIYLFVFICLPSMYSTISCMYFTAIDFISPPSSLQSPKSHQIQLYFVQTP